MPQSLRTEPEKIPLEDWLAGLGYPVREIEALSGDVSPRRYSRVLVEGGSTAILASYPPEVAATCVRFLRSTALLERAGVRV